MRVGAHELRKKLESYYKSEGKSDDLILGIPVGSYTPIFTRSNRLQGLIDREEPDTVAAARSRSPSSRDAIRRARSGGYHARNHRRYARVLQSPTTKDHLRYLSQRLLQPGGTLLKYYQVLLKVAVDNGIPTTVSIVSVHELHSDRQ